MDKVLKGLFKNGDLNNGGDITLKCVDQVSLKCHSLILSSQSGFFKAGFSAHPDKKEFIIDYDSKLVKILINKMYNSFFPLEADINIYDVLALFKMIDEFLILDGGELFKHLMYSFKNSLSLVPGPNHWLTVLKKIYEFDCYKALVNEIFFYFRNKVLVPDLKNDPLEDVELDTDLGRKLYKIVLSKAVSRGRPPAPKTVYHRATPGVPYFRPSTGN